MEADAEPGPAPAKRKRLSRKAQLRELAKEKKERRSQGLGPSASAPLHEDPEYVLPQEVNSSDDDNAGLDVEVAGAASKRARRGGKSRGGSAPVRSSLCAESRMM